MGNDVTWWKQQPEKSSRNQHTHGSGSEVPGDTDAPDIVGRTGEEMPDVAHDDGGEDGAEDASERRDEQG